MSLVIASNQVSDSISDTNSSIFKPWSFRNDLSSTYTIPSNGQVALQSVKYNLDGTIDLANDGQVLYQYTGEILDDGTDTMDDSTAVPIRTELFEGDGIEEVSVDQLAEKIELAINKKVYHPMLKDLAEVDVKRKPATNEFEGFNIVYKTNDDVLTNVVPADKYAIDGLYNDQRIGTDAELWTYSSGVFSTTSFIDGEIQSIILVDKPVSLYNGSMEFDISAVDTVANAFGVGSTRLVLFSDSAGDHCVPEYFVGDTLWNDASQSQDMMCDFFVYTDPSSKLLRVAHAVADSSDAGFERTIRMKEVDYLSNTTSHFNGDATKYDMGTNTDAYTKIKMDFNNQQVKISLVKADLTEVVLIDYDSTAPKGANLKPVNQSCWDLLPYMWLETVEGSTTNSITFDGMNQCSWLQDYAPYDVSGVGGKVDVLKGSWYNLLEGQGETEISQNLELRPWNDYSSLVSKEITIKGLATSPFKFLDIGSVLIVKQSDLYSPSIGANSGEILGFDDQTIEQNNTTTADLTRTFASTTIPQLLSTKTMFVRLDNFTQTTTNAFQGNRSSIIAHLPRFDGQIQTGRIYHEPKNLIFLDLHNSEPLKVNSFDISFCYSNEQYVQALTGQSVVVLYFRAKPE